MSIDLSDLVPTTTCSVKASPTVHLSTACHVLTADWSKVRRNWMTEVDIVTKEMEDMLEEQIKIQNEARS